MYTPDCAFNDSCKLSGFHLSSSLCTQSTIKLLQQAPTLWNPASFKSKIKTMRIRFSGFSGALLKKIFHHSVHPCIVAPFSSSIS